MTTSEGSASLRRGLCSDACVSTGGGRGPRAPPRGEGGVHTVLPDGHGHAVRGVCPANRAPSGEPHADGLPAAAEAEVDGSVDINRKVRLGGETVAFDLGAAGG